MDSLIFNAKVSKVIFLRPINGVFQSEKDKSFSIGTLESRRTYIWKSADNFAF